MRTRTSLSWARTGAAFLALGLLAGCGTGPELINADAGSALHRDVQAIRAAADPGDALDAVEDFRHRVQTLVAAGGLDPADALVLLAHADHIATSLESPPTEPPSTREEPSPAAPRATGFEQPDEKNDRPGKRGKDDRERDKDQRGRDAGDRDDRGDDDDDDDDD